MLAAIGLRHQQREISPHHFRRLVAEYPLGGGIEGLDRPAVIGGDDPFRHRIHDPLETLLPLAQRFGGALAFADVARLHHEQLVAVAAQRHDHGFDVDDAPVATQEFEWHRIRLFGQGAQPQVEELPIVGVQYVGQRPTDQVGCLPGPQHANACGIYEGDESVIAYAGEVERQFDQSAIPLLAAQ